MKNEQKQQQILVLGANGKTGSRVVTRLNKLGVLVRAGSRNAAIPFDWENRNTWKPVLKDITAVYITFQPDLAIPGAVDLVRGFCEAAVDEGVSNVVLLSGRGEEEALACEAAVKAIFSNCTIVRAAWFFENFSESFFLEPILQGQVTLPVSKVSEPFISCDDIAEIVAMALTSDGHSGKLYEVTGDRLITFEEAIGEIAKASNRKIEYETVTIETYASLLSQLNIPKEYTGLLTYLFTEVLDGRNEHTTSTVREVLGRKPIAFSDYVKKTVLTGVWNV